MKNIFLSPPPQQRIAMVLIGALIASLGFYACSKDFISENNLNEETYMHRMVGGQDVVLTHEMLCFKDSVHFGKVLDSLEQAYEESEEEEFYTDTNEFVMTHPVFNNFEQQFPSYKSLRSEVAEKVVAAIENESFPEHNPEEDYMPGATFRILLNKYSEVKIGDIIYKYIGRSILVQIANDDTEALYALRAGADPATLGENVSYEVLSVNGTPVVTDCSTAVSVSTKALIPALTDFQAEARVTSYQGVGNQTATYTVDWGDGTPNSNMTAGGSTLPSVIHTYSNSGTYWVESKRTDKNCNDAYQKVTIGTGDCGGSLGLSLNTQVENETDIKVIPTVTGGTPARICWRITSSSVNGLGDYFTESSLYQSGYSLGAGMNDWGSPTQNNLIFPGVRNGTYFICVGVFTADGCYAEACTSVKVEFCCRGNDENLQTNYFYSGGTGTGGRLLYINLYKNTGSLNHRVGSEAKHYVNRRKDNGKGSAKWRETKADRITILQDGQVRKEQNNANCRGDQFSVYLFLQKSNKQSLSGHKSVGKKFGSYDVDIPWATFTVRHNGIDYSHTFQFPTCN